jgi:hypothetical protein
VDSRQTPLRQAESIIVARHQQFRDLINGKISEESQTAHLDIGSHRTPATAALNEI